MFIFFKFFCNALDFRFIYNQGVKAVVIFFVNIIVISNSYC